MCQDYIPLHPLDTNRLNKGSIHSVATLLSTLVQCKVIQCNTSALTYIVMDYDVQFLVTLSDNYMFITGATVKGGALLDYTI